MRASGVATCAPRPTVTTEAEADYLRGRAGRFFDRKADSDEGNPRRKVLTVARKRRYTAFVARMTKRTRRERPCGRVNG